MKAFFAFFFLLISAGLSFAATTTKTSLEKTSIDFCLALQNEKSQSYVSWMSKSSKKHDHYDVKSGASISRASQSLAALSVDSKKKILPKGLRALLLYAVSPRETAVADALTIEQQGKDGRQLTISFVHRGVAYRLESDSRGYLDLEKSFFIAEKVAENSGGRFTLLADFLPGAKPKKTAEAESAGEPGDEDTQPGDEDTQPAGEYAESPADSPQESVSQPQAAADESSTPAATADSASASPFSGDAGDMHNIVWENVDFQPDRASDKAKDYFTGRLRVSYRQGCLTLQGKLIPASREAADQQPGSR